MKKLLAIAVAAAITVPTMVAMADTTVYGKAHVALEDTNEKGVDFGVVSKSSRLGFKGSNALDNGLSATHKVEMDIGNIIDGEGGLKARDAWVGLKGGFGEVRIGRHTIPSDIVDDAADFMTNGAKYVGSSGRTPNALAYIGKFGNVGFAVARVQPGDEKDYKKAKGSDVAHDLMANYAAGPLYAGVGVNAPKDGKAGAKVALAYKGANYGIGLVAGNKTLSKAEKDAKAEQNTFTTLSGKYGFGKAYVAAEFGLEKQKADDSQDTNTIFEVGYGLGKGTKTYLDYTANKDDSAKKTKKTARIGLVHKF